MVPGETKLPMTPEKPDELSPQARRWLRVVFFVVLVSTPFTTFFAEPIVEGIVHSNHLTALSALGGLVAAGFLCAFLHARLENKKGESLIFTTIVLGLVIALFEFCITVMVFGAFTRSSR